MLTLNFQIIELLFSENRRNSHEWCLLFISMETTTNTWIIITLLIRTNFQQDYFVTYSTNTVGYKFLPAINKSRHTVFAPKLMSPVFMLVQGNKDWCWWYGSSVWTLPLLNYISGLKRKVYYRMTQCERYLYSFILIDVTSELFLASAFHCSHNKVHYFLGEVKHSLIFL